ALADVAGQRLLAVDVLLALERRHGGKGMGVLSRADDHGVELAVLEGVVHLAEITELLCLWGRLGGLEQVPLVHVAQGDDVLALELPEVVRAAPAGADEREVELVVGRARADEGRAAEGCGPGRGRGPQER